MPLDLAAVRDAHLRIRPHVHRTPVLTSARLDARFGGRVFFKCENLQKVGAFKARGATNAVLSLPETAARHGVATHSSGNHAAALARAAGLRGIPAYIVMPENSAPPKIRAVEGYGGHITFCAPTQAAREAACARIMAETGATLVHPFVDDAVIAGQGTVALEFLEQVPDLDLLLCPVGGGGLLAGTAVTARALSPRMEIIGTEPAEAADAAASWAAGRVVPLTSAATVADGLRTSIGQRTFELAHPRVAGIATVTEAGILGALRLVWETLKVVIEPSAAVPVAALLENRVSLQGRRAGVILSGGNADLDALGFRER